MSSFIGILQGKKTYIVAGFLLVGVACEKLLGIDIPGFDPGANWLGTVLEAAGLTTLRAAIAKV